jgi:hypothetical protein
MKDKPPKKRSQARKSDANPRHEELWEAVFSPLKQPATDAARRRAAIELLAELPKLAGRSPESDNQIVDRGMIILALLVAELGAPLLKIALSMAELNAALAVADPKATRAILRRLIELAQISLPPTHRDALDPAIIILPRQLLTSLADALAALDQGDVLPLLSPAAVKRRSWDYDMAQLRALEHVEFLVGQGVTKKSSMYDVGAAIGRTTHAMHSWERDLRKKFADDPDIDEQFGNIVDKRLDIARKAGELEVRLRRDPTYGERPGEWIDSHVLRAREELLEESLPKFSEKFKNLFAERRH